MHRLMLDECISPNISARLWGANIDNYPVRDRGLLEVSDHVIWSLAAQDNRTLVTHNARHFRALALRETGHPGLLTIPSGGNRDKQFENIMKAVFKIDDIPMSFANNLISVSDDGDVLVELNFVKAIQTA